LREDGSYAVLDDRPTRVAGAYESGGRAGRVYGTEGKAVALQGSTGGAGAAAGLYLDRMRLRRLTPAECARLQTIPAWWLP
jgi:site-specific DNA-cytosine methylase